MEIIKAHSPSKLYILVQDGIKRIKIGYQRIISYFSADNYFHCVHVFRINTYYVMLIHSCDRNYWYNLITKVGGGFFTRDCLKVETSVEPALTQLQRQRGVV